MARILEWTDLLGARFLERLSDVRIRETLIIADVVAENGEADGLLAVDAALDLLEQHSPRRYRSALRELRAIHLTKLTVYAGQYRHLSRTCRLDRAFVLSRSEIETAHVIVHEITHARLMRLGIRYDESIRNRVELACDREALRFLEGAAAAPELVDSHRKALGRPSFTDAQLLEGVVAQLKDRGVPPVAIRGILWLRRIATWFSGKLPAGAL
jgi:hypothetical protein